MKLERSKEWWMRQAYAEPDLPCGVGVPQNNRLGMGMKLFLRARAKCAYLWRIGLIERTTAFRWEMDDFLGEYTRRNAQG